MASTKSIRFGWFLYWKRVEKGLSYRKLSEAAGVSQPMLFSYVQDEEPRMYDSTYGKLAKALGMTLEEMDAWRTTPVKQPPARGKRSGVGVDPVIVGMNFVREFAGYSLEYRTWLLGQLSHADCHAIVEAINVRLTQPDGARMPISSGPPMAILPVAKIDRRAAVALKPKPARQRPKK